MTKNIIIGCLVCLLIFPSSRAHKSCPDELIEIKFYNHKKLVKTYHWDNYVSGNSGYPQTYKYKGKDFKSDSLTIAPY